jgi:hypothetical protein
LWYFYRSRAAGPDLGDSAATPPVAATSPATDAAAPAPAPQTETPAPVARKRTPAPPVATTVESPDGDHKIWRVVVYTFANKSAAEHKVAALTTEHPDLKPEVFSAKGQSPWLVTVGGPMDHAQAVQLRGQVRSQGMPGDSYAQNYSH